ncbi:MAG: hypothetical protein HS104_16775 [Polyangiaceae bacterium]|nr:hypothetical protein [Polyangiaceae bacterium]
MSRRALPRKGETAARSAASGGTYFTTGISTVLISFVPIPAGYAYDTYAVYTSLGPKVTEPQPQTVAVKGALLWRYPGTPGAAEIR